MRLVLLGLTLITTFASPAFAHPGTDYAHSFASGVLHPLTGADHVFAMASIGVWGTFVAGRAIWAWPATFIAAALAGFAAVLLGLQISIVEPVISASIVVLGLLVALGVKASLPLGAAVVGLFGFFHGHAHGTEATAANVIAYAAGFTFSTAMLHGAGIGLGLCSRTLIERIVFAPARRMQSNVRGRGLR